MRVSVGVSMDQDLVDEIDSRLGPQEARAEWIRQAINARIAAEDAGEWQMLEAPQGGQP